MKLEIKIVVFYFFHHVFYLFLVFISQNMMFQAAAVDTMMGHSSPTFAPLSASASANIVRSFEKILVMLKNRCFLLKNFFG